MKGVLKIFFLLLYATSSFAQGDSLIQKQRKNNIQVGFGFIHTRLIDEGFTHSRLLFRGTNPQINLGYGRENNQAFFGFLASISDGYISTKQNRLATSFVKFSAAIEYLRKIKTFTCKRYEGRLLAGLQLSTINYVMINNPIFDNIDIFSLHGIYVKFNYELKLDKKQSLQFNYSLPAMVYANRILWNGGASIYEFGNAKRIIKLLTTHGRYYYFDFMHNIQFNATYQKRLGKTVDFNVGYAFRYVSNSIERPIRLYSNELILGFKFNF